MEKVSIKGTCGPCAANFVPMGDITMSTDGHCFVGEDGYRITASGDPACMHPDRLAPYINMAAADTPPVEVEIRTAKPAETANNDQLITWALGRLSTVASRQLNSALAELEQTVRDLRDPAQTQMIMRGIMRQLSSG